MWYGEEEKKQSRAKRILRNITVEPMLFVANVATYMQIILRDSFKLERFCSHQLDYDLETCRNL